MEIEDLQARIRECTACPLRMTATQPVPGYGAIGCKYMLIGEAPGKNEDEQGMPFIGLAGRRLNQLLELGGISLNECFFTNVVKCRPPSNKTPKKSLIRVCKPWLLQEIKLVQPEIIIALGATPLSLFTTSGVSQMHGTLFEAEIEDI